MPLNRTIFGHSKNLEGKNIYAYCCVTSDRPDEWQNFYGTTFDYVYGVSLGFSLGESQSDYKYEILDSVILILNRDLTLKIVLSSIRVQENELDMIPDQGYTIPKVLVDLSNIRGEETPIWNP